MLVLLPDGLPTLLLTKSLNESPTWFDRQSQPALSIQKIGEAYCRTEHFHFYSYLNVKSKVNYIVTTRAVIPDSSS